jgi:hypothetical protein
VPTARIGARFISGTGSSLSFGTSNSFASGITNTAITINQTPTVIIGGSNSNTAAISSFALTVHNNNLTPVAINRTGSDGSLLNWYRDGSNQAAISISGGTVTYGTGSDLRLKENISDTALGLDLLSQIRVRDFNFINYPGERSQGFIAQELHFLYPNAVYVGGDDVHSDPWQIDYGRITPLIVKSVQELNLKIEDLATTSPALGEAEGFTGRFFAALKERMVHWFADAANGIERFTTRELSFEHAKGGRIQSSRAEHDETHTNKLCVGSTCVTEAQLTALLAAQSTQNSSGSTSQTGVATGSSSQTSTTTSQNEPNHQQLATSTEVTAPPATADDHQPATSSPSTATTTEVTSPPEPGATPSSPHEQSASVGDNAPASSDQPATSTPVANDNAPAPSAISTATTTAQ